MSMQEQILDLARRARRASARAAVFDTRTKNDWLARVAERLEDHREEILTANARDMDQAREKGVSDPLVNRLALSEDKWNDMIQGLRETALFRPGD